MRRVALLDDQHHCQFQIRNSIFFLSFQIRNSQFAIASVPFFSPSINYSTRLFSTPDYVFNPTNSTNSTNSMNSLRGRNPLNEDLTPDFFIFNLLYHSFSKDGRCEKCHQVVKSDTYTASTTGKRRTGQRHARNPSPPSAKSISRMVRVTCWWLYPA